MRMSPSYNGGAKSNLSGASMKFSVTVDRDEDGAWVV